LFWDDFEEMSKKDQRQERSSTVNKIFRFAIDPTIRNIVGQAQPKLKFKDIMSDRKILLVPLPAELGEKQASFIGALILTQLHMVGLNRPEDYRPPFHIYVDEFHHFLFGSAPEMFSGLRKFNVSLTVAHQFVDQLTDEMRKAVFGTAGTIVSFNLGPEDAPTLSPSFGLRHREGEPMKTLLDALPPRMAHVKTPRRVFYDVQTLPLTGTGEKEIDLLTYPPGRDFVSVRAQLQHESRLRYARPRDEVEAELQSS
jgi:hypothetical protein